MKTKPDLPPEFAPPPDTAPPPEPLLELPPEPLSEPPPDQPTPKPAAPEPFLRRG